GGRLLSDAPPTPQLHALSLHDALPIFSSDRRSVTAKASGVLVSVDARVGTGISAFSPFATLAPDDGMVLHGEIDERYPPLRRRTDRKSTRLNSSHVKTSYAVFCLKKKT